MIVAVDICFHLITYSSTRSSTNVLSEERANFAGEGGVRQNLTPKMRPRPYNNGKGNFSC